MQNGHRCLRQLCPCARGCTIAAKSIAQTRARAKEMMTQRGSRRLCHERTYSGKHAHTRDTPPRLSHPCLSIVEVLLIQGLEDGDVVLDDT